MEEACSIPVENLGKPVILYFPSILVVVYATHSSLGLLLFINIVTLSGTAMRLAAGLAEEFADWANGESVSRLQ